MVDSQSKVNKTVLCNSLIIDAQISKECFVDIYSAGRCNVYTIKKDNSIFTSLYRPPPHQYNNAFASLHPLPFHPRFFVVVISEWVLVGL